MHCYNIIINLFETLSEISGQDAFLGVDLQQALYKSTIRFETLLRLYYLRHGCESYDIFMVHYFSFLGLKYIKAPDNIKASEAERKSTIALSLKGLRAQGRNYYLAQVVFRLVKDALGPDAQQLMKEVAEVTEEDDESKSLIQQHVNSSWPVGLSSISMDPNAQRLGNRIAESNVN